MNLCINCKHHYLLNYDAEYEHLCKRHYPTIIDPVTGKFINKELPCERERKNTSSRRCGTKGKFFEAKQPTIIPKWKLFIRSMFSEE